MVYGCESASYVNIWLHDTHISHYNSCLCYMRYIDLQHVKCCCFTATVMNIVGKINHANSKGNEAPSVDDERTSVVALDINFGEKTARTHVPYEPLNMSELKGKL